MNTKEEILKSFDMLPKKEKLHFLYWEKNFSYQLDTLLNKYKNVTGDLDMDIEFFSKFYYLEHPEDIQHTLN